VVAAAPSVTSERDRRAATDGRAAAEAEKDKARRYKRADNPGEGLVAFAVESRGRLGEEAAGLLRAMAPEDKQRRAIAIRDARQTISVVIQMRLAELLLSAER
jgi:hypothetical protein